MTLAEIQRLVHALDEAPAERQHRLHWSFWRRAHQATARRGHVARRHRQTPAAPAHTPTAVSVPGTPLLTEALWVRLLAVLPPPRPTGRPQGDAHPIVAGLLWMMHTGMAWRAIPPEYGSWHTLYSRYRLWCSTGIWPQITAALRSDTGPDP